MPHGRPLRNVMTDLGSQHYRTKVTVLQKCIVTKGAARCVSVAIKV